VSVVTDGYPHGMALLLRRRRSGPVAEARLAVATVLQTGFARSQAALAVGATALGAVAIGRLAVKRAAFGRIEIDELVVKRLRVEELDVAGEKRPPAAPEKLPG
jgi:hypothetical protein